MPVAYQRGSRSSTTINRLLSAVSPVLCKSSRADGTKASLPAVQKRAGPTPNRRTTSRKDHRERTARLQLIEHMSACHSWQTAAARSQLHVSRSTAYRLVKLARDAERTERALSSRSPRSCLHVDRASTDVDDRVWHHQPAGCFESSPA